MEVVPLEEVLLNRGPLGHPQQEHDSERTHDSSFGESPVSARHEAVQNVSRDRQVYGGRNEADRRQAQERQQGQREQHAGDQSTDVVPGQDLVGHLVLTRDRVADIDEEGQLDPTQCADQHGHEERHPEEAEHGAAGRRGLQVQVEGVGYLDHGYRGGPHSGEQDLDGKEAVPPFARGARFEHERTETHGAQIDPEA